MQEPKALDENDTWDLVPYPPVSPIGCKWMFTVNLKNNGFLDRYKERLIALGYKQEYELEYDETSKVLGSSCYLSVCKRSSHDNPLFQCLFLKLGAPLTNQIRSHTANLLELASILISHYFRHYSPLDLLQQKFAVYSH